MVTFSRSENKTVMSITIETTVSLKIATLLNTTKIFVMKNSAVETCFALFQPNSWSVVRERGIRENMEYNHFEANGNRCRYSV